MLNVGTPKSNSKQVGIIKYRVVDVNDLEIVVDQARDLFSAKESVFFLSLMFLQTDLELEILDDLVQNRGNCRVEHLEIGKN